MNGLAASAPEKKATVYLITEVAGFKSVLINAEVKTPETEIGGHITGDDGNAISLLDSSDRLQVIPWSRIRKIVFRK